LITTTKDYAAATALPPNDPLFVNLVQNVLTTLEGTGAFEELSARWFENDSWLNELP
jgi:hypothetical protein